MQPAHSNGHDAYRRFGRSFRFCAMLCLTALLGDARGAEPVKKVAKQPLTRSAIEELVSRHLRSNPAYAPGDLITQTDIEPIFNELIERGYPSPENEGLYDSFLPNRDYFVQAMRTPQGRIFMRQVAKLPQAFDRLERLSWSQTGRNLLAELISSTDGKKAFEHMLSDEGAKGVETMLANDPRGRNFQLPTGKVHTANELIEHLSDVYLNDSAQ